MWCISEVLGMGRQPKYDTPEQMEAAIEEYFEGLYRPIVILNKRTGDREVLIDDKTGKQIREQYRPATVTGLARALGMTREGLAHYRKKSDAFADTITRARLRVQEYAEERLYDKDGQRGAEFSLRVNFGWIPADVERELKVKERTVALQETKLKGISDDVGEINKGIQSLASLLNSPVPNREVKDYEE